MKHFYEKYKHAIPLLIFMGVYLVWFFVLESKVTTYRIIHTEIDDRIPFCEIFVIPYFLWFAYVAVSVLIAFFTDKETYFKSLIFLATGMTIFLTISTLWPNGHNLRPLVMPRDNIFSRMVAGLYRTDTPTNLWPSIHVYNSIGAHLCIARCSYTKNKKGIKLASLVLCVSIILSTMFIKQHSLFDVFTALLMSVLMSLIVYRKDIILYFKELKENSSENAHESIFHLFGNH